MTTGTLSATAGSIRISPKRQVILGASEDNHLPWGGIDSHIEANVLALWDVHDEYPLFLISLDLLYPGRIIREAIDKALAPVPPERIVVAASHTHRAPMTDDTKPALGIPDDEYLEWLVQEISSLVQMMLAQKRVDVRLTIGDELASHSINRRLKKRFMLARKPRFNEVVNAPNPEGVTDELLTTILVRDTNQQPIALLWNYACHPVDGPALNATSGHFPSDIREMVRSALGDASLPVLFFQGFSGNTRPSATTGAHSLSRRIRQAVSGPLFERMREQTYHNWSRELGRVLLKAIESEKPIEPNGLVARRLSLPSTDYAFSATGTRDDVTVARIDLSDDVSLITVSAEVVAEFASRVRALMPGKKVLCVGCVDHVIGYIPTQSMLIEGGYEAEGFCKPFGLSSVNPGVEAALYSALAQIATD